MSEWKEYKLGEIATFSYGSLPKKQLLGKGEYITYSGYKYLESYPEYNCEEGDVILVARGVGGTGDVKLTSQKCYLTNLSIRISLNNDIILNKYFYYIYQIENLRYLDSGSVQSQITIKDLSNVILEIPSLEYQKDVVNILSSLDDKIDLLRRENATLEAMAETLFRQWFVVEAKEEWEEGKLGDLIEVKYGKDHKKLSEGIIPVIGSGGVMRYADKYLYDKESVLIPRKGSLNNVMYINEPFWTVDTMFYTKMQRSNITKYVYHFMKGQDLANMNVGSAVPSMTTEVLNNIPVDIPPQEVFDRFENAVASLYNKKKQNNKQIQTLIQTRDGLLPRLMSGEIKI
jgi:type I restriction enzyme S subunit